MTKIILGLFFHKSASTFGFKLFKELSSHYDHVTLFSRDHRSPNEDDFLCSLKNPEYLNNNDLKILAPIRNFDNEFIDQSLHIIQQKKYPCSVIIQTRHMLDLAVSQYFSHGWIHNDQNFSPSVLDMKQKILSGKISLADYVYRSIFEGVEFGGKALIQKYQSLDNLITTFKNAAHINLNFLKYEDMVLNQPLWIKKLNRSFRIDTSLENLSQNLMPNYSEFISQNNKFYANSFDYIQDNKLSHIRSPIPGNHKQFLTELQIDDLQAKISNVSKLYSRLYIE